MLQLNVCETCDMGSCLVQVNELEAEKVKLNSEAFRLELELSKVLRENEELFKTRLGGGAGIKTGASAHLVHSLKRKIKELEAAVEKKEGELRKVKSDTRVTRLAEMEVEKDAYLYEVRRLKRELARIATATGSILGAGISDAGDGTQRDADDLRRKVRRLTPARPVSGHGRRSGPGHPVRATLRPRDATAAQVGALLKEREGWAGERRRMEAELDKLRLAAGPAPPLN
jgi:hypothetical protein